MKDGFSDIYNFLSKLNEKNTELIKIELAVDYANLFLGVLYARRREGIIHPSESVYLTGLLYQEPAEEVENLYLDFGLVKDEKFKEPEDHIALELYFMAHLSAKSIRALEHNELHEVKKLLKAQKEFLEKHILKWVPKLAQDILQYAETEFYRGIAKITNGYLEADKILLKELLEKIENIVSEH
ncbi:MAG: molecular chaperone TorD family protein [Nitrososphaerota archaeon]